MAETERIVAIGLLTQQDIRNLGQGFDRLYAIDQTPCFNTLLLAIDDADRDFRRAEARGDTGPLRA